MRLTGSATFRPRARLIRLLGEELISDEVMAVSELVKNSFDADATTVTVRLLNLLTSDQGLIEIVDDGYGMSHRTLLDAWLEPATSFKRTGGRKRRTPRGRYPLGEKGVGRFAADKLGAELELVSRARGSDEEVCLSVSWDAFVEADYLDEVDNVWEVRAPLEFPGERHGTLLRMRKPRATWTPHLLARVHEGLSRLAAPAARGDFRIIVECPDFPEFAGLISNSTIENAPYRLVGRVDSDGLLVMEEPDRRVIDLRQHAGDHFRIDGGARPACCGPFTISLSVWDLDVLGEAGARPTRGLRAMLRQMSGVSIYRDDFRVAPYGNRGDDWLELNQRRVNNPTMRVSTNQIVGTIEITQEHNRYLRDRTDREGLIHTPAFDDLRVLVIASLARLEEHRYALRKASMPPPSEETDPVLAHLERARGERGSGAAALAAAAAYRKYRDETERRQQILLRLASAGAASDCLLGPLGGLLASLSDSLAALHPRAGEAIEVERVRQQAQLLARQFDALDRFFAGASPRPEPADVRSLAQDALGIYAPVLAAMSVRASVTASEPLIVRTDRSAVLQALLHVLENAILEAASQPSDRWIEIVAQADPPSLTVRDSGPGVSDDRCDLIFEPYFSGREGGAGLGLYFARALLQTCGGDISLTPDGSAFLLTVGSC